MLQQLSIKNFQSHKNTELSFSSGVNTIIGQTDAGKTAILRSLKLVLSNKPSGTAYISTFAGPKDVTEVSLLTAEQQKIIRKRNASSINTYAINDEKPLEAIGAGAPPQEILDILRMGDINVSSQLDAPFLLSASSGEVARYMNQIAGLDKIDSALSHMTSVISDVKKSIKITEADCTKIADDLLAFETIPEIEFALSELEELQGEFSNVEDTITKIEAITASIILLEQQQNEVLQWLQIEPLAAVLNEKIDKQIAADLDVESLTTTVSGIALLEASLAETNRWLEVEDHYETLMVDLHCFGADRTLFDSISTIVTDIGKLEEERTVYPENLIEQIEDIEALAAQCGNMESKEAKLSVLIAAIEVLCDSQDSIVDEIAEAETLYHSMQPDTCPLCGGANA